MCMHWQWRILGSYDVTIRLCHWEPQLLITQQFVFLGYLSVTCAAISKAESRLRDLFELAPLSKTRIRLLGEKKILLASSYADRFCMNQEDEEERSLASFLCWHMSMVMEEITGLATSNLITSMDSLEMTTWSFLRRQPSALRNIDVGFIDVVDIYLHSLKMHGGNPLFRGKGIHDPRDDWNHKTCMQQASLFIHSHSKT